MIILRDLFKSQSKLRLGKLGESLGREQHAMLQRNALALYVALGINILILTIIFYKHLPTWLGLYFPAIFLLVIASRGAYWFRSQKRGREPNLRKIQRDLTFAAWSVPILTLSYSAIALFPTTIEQTIYTNNAVLVIWCTALMTSFALNTLPRTSMLVVLCSGIPISISFASQGNGNITPLAVAILSLSVLAIYINNVTYRSFVDTVVTRWKLTQKNRTIDKEREIANKIASTDLLTGLPNRRNFYDRLNEQILMLELDEAKTFAVAIIDLDGFKPINDLHGHAAGDSVLVDVGARLTKAVCKSGIVARLGGDEFAVLAEGILAKKDAVLLGDHLVDALRPVYNIDSVKAHLTGSCGFHIVDSKGSSSSTILERADLALYKAKSENRGKTEVFSTDMEEKVRKRSRVEQALREAITDNSIEIHFQPIVDLVTQNTIGMEALARWQHPTLGYVSPDWFIPIAEHSGLIAELTENLFRKAIRIANKWPNHYFLSFNLSADHLTRPSVGMNILSIMLQENFDPTRLEIEVTETAIMRDLQMARTTIENLRKAQIKVSLDDFGTGYSSINQIKELPFDKIKIDKSLIDGISNSQRTRSLVLSVIGMCKNLNICCLAEGIEDEEQCKILMNMGCAMGQGYLFGKPIPSSESIDLLNNQMQIKHSLIA